MATRFGYHGTRLRAVVVGIAVSALAILLSQFAAIPAFALDPTILENIGAASRAARTVLLIFNFIGLTLGGVVYLWVTGRGWSFVDLARPGWREGMWIVIGIVLVIGFYVLVGLVSYALDVSTADSDLILILGDDVTMVLIMITIVFLFNAPAEEFLFRNVIQKRLYEAFSGVGAVVVTSIIFVIVHVPMFVTLAEGPFATAGSLVVMFGGSFIFGYVYLRTENLLVPIAVHALINALVLFQYLVTLLYDPEAAMQAVALLAVATAGGA